MRIDGLFTETGRRLGWTTLQFFAMLCCIAFVRDIYYENILPDKLVAETFNQTTCTIMQKTLVSRGKLVKRYRADLAVAYVVNNENLTQWTSVNGLDRSFSTNRDWQVNALAGFTQGSSYLCWYNPDAPEQVVLVFRHNWSSTFPLFIPSVIFLIACYYFLHNLFILGGSATTKTREVMKERRMKKREVK